MNACMSLTIHGVPIMPIINLKDSCQNNNDGFVNESDVRTSLPNRPLRCSSVSMDTKLMSGFRIVGSRLSGGDVAFTPMCFNGRPSNRNVTRNLALESFGCLSYWTSQLKYISSRSPLPLM